MSSILSPAGTKTSSLPVSGSALTAVPTLSNTTQPQTYVWEQLPSQEAHRSQGEGNISEWQTMGRSPKCTFAHLVSHQFHQLSMLAGSSLRFTENRRAHCSCLLHQLKQEVETVMLLVSWRNCCLPSLTQRLWCLFTVVLGVLWSAGAMDTEWFCLGRSWCFRGEGCEGGLPPSIWMMLSRSTVWPWGQVFFLLRRPGLGLSSSIALSDYSALSKTLMVKINASICFLQ